MQRDVTACNTVQREETKKRPDTDTEEKEIKKQSKDKKQREKKKGECERKKRCAADSSQIPEQMLQIWNAEVQSKLSRGHKAALTPKRRELMTMRWLDDFRQDMDAWRYYCEIIAASDFCLGKLEGKDWTIDLTWAVKSPENVAKIFEGGFSGGSHPSKPPACEVPDLDKAWKQTITSLQEKHGKGAIRSWFAGCILTKISSMGGETIATLQVPRKFSRDWIKNHFADELQALLGKHHGKEISINLTGVRDKNE